MGGSFNPPRVARQELMKDAMKAVEADLGFFVQAAKGTVDQWRGLNLLGCALMEVRDWLRES